LVGRTRETGPAEKFCDSAHDFNDHLIAANRMRAIPLADAGQKNL